jgi:eukaryotic-like serine/threonine-protein kinase
MRLPIIAGSFLYLPDSAWALLMPASSDRNLLFGILALQMDFITREQLVAGMQAWVLAKEIFLAEHLVRAGALRPEHRQLLEPLVEAHIRQHGDDPQQSLASISSLDALRSALAGLGDQQVDASIANIPAGSKSAKETDPYATISVGAASSQGMRFRILRPHAEGGLGRVSVALDGELGREVALKEIKPERADDPDSRGRFTREAEITGGLEHPGIVPVYGLGAYPDGRPFYAMRFIRGKSLKEAIEKFHAGIGTGDWGLGTGEKASGGRKPPDSSSPRKAFSPTEENLELRKLLQRLIDVCEAMDYAHSRGVLHRDLKPGNIMLGKYGETLVVDWGLAKSLGQPAAPTPEQQQTGTTVGLSSLPEGALHPSSTGGSEPTMLGSALGTPAFMSPEQAQGRIDLLSPISDVFSLGAILYQILTGQPPYVAPTKEEVLRKAQVGDYPVPRALHRGIPASLEAICLKALSTFPKDRYPTCLELAKDLERFLADEPVSAYQDSFAERLVLQSLSYYG